MNLAFLHQVLNEEDYEEHATHAGKEKASLPVIFECLLTLKYHCQSDVMYSTLNKAVAYRK
jgi:hypothetical protein